MKKTYWLIIALLILVLGTTYLINTKGAPSDTKKSSIDLSDRAFSIENTEDIFAISIQKGREKGYLLQRNGNEWIINKKHKVAASKMPQILKVLEKIKVNTIPSRNALPNIMKYMRDNGIKVKVYDKDNNVIKSFTIGRESTSGEGTIFLMDGHQQPYNMYIPGFEGIIRPRFLQPLDNWRDVAVVEVDPENIQKVSLHYPKYQSQSFVLETTEPSVLPYSQYVQPTTKSVDPSKLKAYLGNFMKINAEAFDNNNAKKDSVQNLIPFATLTITEKNGKERTMNFYPFIELLDSSVEIKNAQDAVQIERYFVDIEGEDFMVVQHRLWKDVFVAYDYFF